MGLLLLLLLTQSVKFKVADTLLGLSDGDLSAADCQFTANIYVVLLLPKGRVISSCWGGGGRHMQILNRIFIANPRLF